MGDCKPLYFGRDEEYDSYRCDRLVLSTKMFSRFLPKALSRLLENGIKMGHRPATPKALRKELSGYTSRSGYVVWTDEGDKFYGDFGDEIPEWCTRLIKVEQGFGKKFADVVMKQRAQMVIKGRKAYVSNSHYNRTIYQELDTYAFRRAAGPALALMLFSNHRTFKSFDASPDQNKFELKSPALMDRTQLEAGAVFLEGCLRGFEKLHEEYSMVVANDKLPLKVGHDGRFESVDWPVRDYGPDAKMRTDTGEEKTALEFFQAYLGAFRKEIEEVATPEEMAILDGFADGKRKFEVELKPSHAIDGDYIIKQTGKTPEELAKTPIPPEGAAKLFGDAAKNREKKIGAGTTRRTYSISWKGIEFDYRADSASHGRDVVAGRVIPFRKMESYLELESRFAKENGDYETFMGALDALLAGSAD